MGILNFEDLQPGMILGGDIRDRNGLVLLGKGHKITDKDLRILMMWGVTEADIEGIDREEVISRVASQCDPALLEKIEKQLRERFCHTDQNHPFIRELFRLMTLRTARQSSEKGRHDL
jgi:hypothetical protein